MTSPVLFGSMLVGIALFASTAVAQADAKKDRVAAPAGAKAASAPMPPPGTKEAVQPNVAARMRAQLGASKQQCEADLLKDVAWRQQLTNQLRKLVGLSERPIDASVYVSPLRESCTKVMHQDTSWRSHIRTKYLLKQVHAEIRAELRPDVHAQDTELILRNRKHVVMAYAALWIVAIVFVMILWVRQRGLSREISELETQLARVIAEDAKS